MASIFTKIVNGEIPCYKIAESEKFLAFLDVFPLVPGHVLVIPKKETDYIFDLTDVDVAEMMVFAKHVAVALKSSVTCKRIGIAVIGLEVPHAHIHLVPLNTMDNINFSNPKLNLPAGELAEMAEKIRANYASSQGFLSGFSVKKDFNPE